MKKIIIIFSLLVFTISCGDSTKKTDKSIENGLEVVDKTSETPSLALVNFDADAGKYLDKEIQLKGIVDHVCKHGGKKILLVDDYGDAHVESETRFDDAIVGSEILVKGVVEEFRVDEAYCLQKEEDYLQNHKDGTDSADMYKQKMEQIAFFRDSMKTAKTDHISYYSLKYTSHVVIKEGEEEEEKTEEVKEEVSH